MLCSAESIYTFTNCTVGSMELEIYDVVSKQNSFSLILPESSWANGYIGAGQSAPSVQSTTTPWCSPRESVEFNTMWIVKRKLKIELGPGRTHEHRSGATFNMLLDTDKTTLYQSLKGLTHGVLYVHKGQICDDVNTFTIGDIGLSKTKLVCCSRTKVMLRQVPCLPRKSVVSFNNLSTVAAFATNENVVQEGSGIITNVVTSAS